jgi:hypothetical protein
VLVATCGALLLAAGTCSCAGGPPTIDPAGVDGLEIPTPSADPGDFTDAVDNAYLPLDPGSRWVYAVTGAAGDLTEVVTVTGTRTVQGVTTTVVQDVTRDERRRVVSDERSFYAQDTDGNVWIFGQEHGGGRDAAGPTWEAGVDGAEAGLVMAADSRVGDGYAMGLADGIAEDRARVLAVSDQRTVPAGEYDDLVQLEVTSPLEPGVVERRFYAPGVGLVYAETITGDSESVQLVRFRQG